MGTETAGTDVDTLRVVVSLTFGTDGFAAVSSADFRIARLMCAVAVAGRRFGCAEDEVAGVVGAAGASFLAGVVATAGVLGVAVEVLGVLLDDFLVAEGEVGLVFFVADEDVFLTVASVGFTGVEVVFFASRAGVEVVLVAAWLVGLSFDDFDGLDLEPVVVLDLCVDSEDKIGVRVPMRGDRIGGSNLAP